MLNSKNKQPSFLCQQKKNENEISYKILNWMHLLFNLAQIKWYEQK